ncbi:hypothetical protein GCM10029976_094210 [Kribbella albertanoniae]|uniref:ArsR family transcriptional regulator n=1 Tax=Kribbella albertanoniae TaxID=1266829 RepID=A0A4V2XSR5_9ACTN|nr:methyltransferase [Kribbella albertanoniae]TDC34655.1 ArsR family transcriptional regulator [Kribbella albertanoniae]
MTPRALMSLLFNGTKAIDVLQTALDLGLLDALEPGPVRLGDLSERFELVPLRLYKLLDCLECIGLVERVSQTPGELCDVGYRAIAGTRLAALEVLGPTSIERDRDRYPWASLHGRLAETLRGDFSMPGEAFSWPPADETQVTAFERSMAAGLGPFIETFQANAERLWRDRGNLRLLDVGGGDGTLAARLLPGAPGVMIDVYNLPAVQPLVNKVRDEHDCADRLGFVGGDFLAEPLPTAYDAMSFVRVLHDWPAPVALTLLQKTFDALDTGGRVMICEEFRNADRLAKQFFWSYFLIGVDSCSSMLRDVEQYADMLMAVGFADIEVLPGPVEIIVATKPSA